ncbi:MAG: response regulator transcription factor, partial [Desulfuromonadales bacterium]
CRNGCRTGILGVGMEQLRVLIVDDHPIITDGLLVFLNNYQDITIVGTANSGMEGLALLRRLHPDCVTIDLSLPDMWGVEAIRLYLKEKPELGIVVYSGRTEDVQVYEALQAGARAYVVKGAPVSALVNAIREVHRGGYWLSHELSPSIVKRYLRRQESPGDKFSEYDSLSDREKQVFLLLARGKTPREIGEALFISIKTVSKHQTSIKNKLGVKNAAAMANYAMTIGLGPVNG